MAHRVRVAQTTAKINAVKLVREMTGFGLKESLDHVENKTWFTIELAVTTLARFAHDGATSGVTFEFDPQLHVTSQSSNLLPIAIGVAGDYAIRYRSGPNKILAIKLTREINPGLGLKEAKDLVEAQGVIRTGVSSSEAQRIVGLFREFESVVEVVQGHAATASAPAPNAPSPSSSGGSGASARAAKPASPAHPATHVYGRPADDDDF